MKTVLLVDDDPACLESWHEVCAQQGFCVCTAGDGEQAWQVLHQTHVDVVISDLRMPRMSGGVLCEKVRDDRELGRMQFILVSGELSPPAFVRYDAYLRKPIDWVALFGVISRLSTPEI